ncbi:hypothetical protein G7Y89_g2626 [Cudoniella acicularis]|uniref:Uncharacterized protein n=1 Tax=Cudoniella acicularis TaxID=354080 RepID=A0A8H4RSZ8_9HELO|nr:hypothetical protein G7Y89_g2626 [Cudoniella acicularis]
MKFQEVALSGLVAFVSLTSALPLVKKDEAATDVDNTYIPVTSHLFWIGQSPKTKRDEATADVDNVYIPAASAFQAPTEAIDECVYTFPLYDGVSVVSFTCHVDDKVLRGLVKEKVKAKQIFDDAVAKGETAGLLTQADEASDVFSTKLGNIPAGESVTVEITYVGELKHHDTDGIRFTIPTKIAPRYGSGPVVSGYQAQDNGGISITVDVNMPEGSFIKGVQSPSHPIAVSMGTISTASNADPTMSKASATLSLGSAALEKDFVLIVQSKDIGIPKATLETHPTIPNHRALMATLVPKSGSMEGNIQMLVSAMQVFLKSMPTGVKFNICSFGSSYSFLWEKSKTYTAETLEEATRHLETFGANMGGTETFRAIKATIDRRFTDIPLEIMLLTDGDIWQQQELFNYIDEQVEKSKGKIRVFPLGIGSGVSHALIEGLARHGNGFAQAVQHGERLDNSVVRMLRGALSPHITDYTLEVKYEQGEDDFELIDKVTEGFKVLLSDPSEATKAAEKKPTISLFDTAANPEAESTKGFGDATSHLPNIPFPKLLQAPHKIPSLFAFSRTSVYLLMSPETYQRNPTAVVLRATSEHGPLALEIPIEVLPSPAETIHQLAAKKAVQDLEEGRGWIYDAKDQNGTLVKDRYPSSFEDLVKKEAVRLGEKFQIAGKWCSFVAVSANDEEIDRRNVSTSNPVDRKLKYRANNLRSLPQLSSQTRATRGGRGSASPPRSSVRSEGAFTMGSFGNAPQPPSRTQAHARQIPPNIGHGPSNLFGGIMRMRSIAPCPTMRQMAPAPGSNAQGLPPPPGALKHQYLMDARLTSAESYQALGSMAEPEEDFAGPRYLCEGSEEEEEVSKGRGESEGWSTKTPIEKLHGFIALQNFDGSWPADDDEISAILGLPVGENPQGGDKSVWVTLIIVCFLEMKMAEEEGTWGMVVEKARGWLEGCGPMDLEDLEKQASEVVKKL